MLYNRRTVHPGRQAYSIPKLDIFSTFRQKRLGSVLKLHAGIARQQKDFKALAGKKAIFKLASLILSCEKFFEFILLKTWHADRFPTVIFSPYHRLNYYTRQQIAFTCSVR